MAQIPYEFLVRLDYITGAVKGAHCKFYDSVTQREGDAQSVAIAGQAGFPLTSILSSVQTGAIIAMDAANLALSTEKTAHAATTSALSAALAKLQAAGIP